MSEFAWKRKELAAKQAVEPVKKRRVLVLYTGGTIGMKWTDKGLSVALAMNIRVASSPSSSPRIPACAQPPHGEGAYVPNAVRAGPSYFRRG